MSKYKKIKLKKSVVKEWRNILPIEYRVHLNESLIKKQKLGPYRVGKVMESHGVRLGLFDMARAVLQDAAEKGKLTKKHQKTMEEIKENLEEAEFDAQAAWGFPLDENYHQWWMDLPGCTCPKMDNQELMGAKYKIYNGDCPWHGDIESLKETQDGDESDD
jgi:hypothetical protein